MEKVYSGHETAKQLITENDYKFTWVGREFYIEVEGFDRMYWKLELYDPETDQYYATKRSDNPSMFMTSWIDAKILRKLVIHEKAFIV